MDNPTKTTSPNTGYEILEPLSVDTTEIEELKEAFSKFEKKYFDLVWYARSPGKDDIHEVYKGTPESIIQGSLNGQAKVEEIYPDEIDQLKGENSSWSHGFNSGCLAAMRFVMTSMETQTFPDQESEDPTDTITMGGIEEAKEEFPFLDT